MKRFFFFDLDGTVTDSEEGILRSVQYSLRHFGINRENEELLFFIGPPLKESFAFFFPGDPQTVDAAVAKYREYYTEKGIFENRLYSGIDVLLRELRDRGHVCCLATSKPEPFVERIIRHFEIADCFDAVAGAQLLGPRNSKEAVLRHACRLCDADDMSRCLMVGDRKYDVCGAHAVGMACVGVLYGYGKRDELRAAGADCLCHSVEHLAAVLKAF
ncbi:MAG: HAD hydrolase-like protein [Desulfovibrio sp.]|nr:HAD hydrolase-like protein [Desulfovibrio sp.]